MDTGCPRAVRQIEEVCSKLRRQRIGYARGSKMCGMDCQDLLETERLRTEILNVADSKRPAEDSVPVKDKGQQTVSANKAVERRKCCKYEAHNGGKRWNRVNLAR